MTNNYFQEGICSACNRTRPVGVASSVLGAMSTTYCMECLQNHAESRGMLEFTFEDGSEKVANWVKDQLYTFEGGKYIRVRESSFNKEIK